MTRISIRNIILAAVLLLLLAIILVVRGRPPFGSGESQFSAGQGREISKIEFSGKNKKIILERRKDTWTVNGIHEARKSGINFILRILTEIKIKSPVSQELFKTEIEGAGVEPVKVRVYAGSRLIRSFIVYPTRTNIYGNVMKRREGAKPFIVYVPGFDGDIGSAFTTSELFWQPYTVFNLLPGEISSVKLENFIDDRASFIITNNHSSYVFCGSDYVPLKCDSSMVRRYLSYFTWVPFEKWAFDLPEAVKAGILASTPAVKITVMKSDGHEVSLSLWEKLNDNGKGIDSDRLWAGTADRPELFVMRYFDVDPILKKRSYFLLR